MRFSIILVISSISLTGFSAPNSKRTVAQIEADIAAISAQADVLAAAAAAFPSTGGSLVAALAIHTDMVNLGSHYDTGTTDVKGTSLPISESDGQAIVADLQALQPKIIDALGQLVNKRLAFVFIGDKIVALFLQDLKNLQTSNDAFMVALTTAEPADLQPQVIAVQRNIDEGYTFAISDYSAL